MMTKFITIFISFLFFLIGNPVLSIEVPQKSLEKHLEKITNKFSKTYCNTINFGISEEGARSFAIGETNKEFKNNQLNNLIDNSLLEKSIVKSLENNCQAYNFPVDILENLKLQ